MPSEGLLATTVLCLALSWPGAAHAADGDPLLAWRDALAAQQTALAGAEARDWTCSAAELLGGGDVELRLHRRGEAWVEAAVEAADGIQVTAIDCSGLRVAASSLGGTLILSWERAAVDGFAGRHWERLREEGERGEQQTSIAVDLRWREGLRRYTLRLADGIDGSSVVLDLLRDGERWRDAFVATPEWNRGLHEIDCSALQVDEGGLRGEVQIVFQPDKWVPKDQKPRRQGYRLDIGDQQGVLGGSFTAQGDLGELQGGIAGSVSVPLEGSLIASGPSGTVYGEASGSTTVPVLAPPAFAADADAASRYRQCAALRRCLQDPSVAPSAALAEARGLAPLSGLEAWQAVLAERFLSADPVQRPAAGNTAPEDPDFGPFFATVAWSTEGLAADGGWSHPPAWQVCGPFPCAPEHSAPALPEVLAVAGTTWAGQGLLDASTDAEPVACTERQRFTVPARELASFAHFDQEAPELWFASTTVESAAAATVWCAIRAASQGQLWCNGVLVWDSEAGVRPYDSTRFAVFPIALQAGSNRFDVRLLQWLEAGAVELFLHAGAGPAAGVGSDETVALPGEAQGFRGDGTARFPDAETPLAWDIEAGSNLAWRTALGPGSGDPVVVGELVFVTAAPNQLLCLGLADGALRWERPVGPAWSGEGLVSTSPLADAERVWALSHHGHLVAFDHQGEELWQVATGLDAGRGIGLAAPVLIAGSVVVLGHAADPESSAARPRDRLRCGVVAYDAATGAERWRIASLTGELRAIHTINGKGNCETYLDGLPGSVNGLSPLRLQRGEHRREVLISSHGQLIDASNGELLQRVARATAMNRCAPYVLGRDVFFTTPQGQSALRFWLDEQGEVGVRELWRDRRHLYFNPPEDAFTDRGTWHKGPVACGGLLFVQRQTWNHWPKHHPKPYCEVSGYAADSGELRGRQTKALWKATNPVGNPALVGGHLLFTDSGDGKYDGTVEHGQVAVALPAARPLVMVDNVCGKLYSTPIASGERLLLRTMDGLSCLRVADGDGGRFQQERIAHYLLDRLPPYPKTPAATRVPPSDTIDPGAEGQPISGLAYDLMPHRWLQLGPLPADTVLPDEAALRPLAGTAVADLGSFAPLDPEHLQVGYNSIVYWSKRPPRTYRIDLGGVTARKPSLTWLYAVWSNSRERTVEVKLDCTGPVTLSAFLNGTPIAPGERLRLQPGCYPLLVRAQLGGMPPMMRSKPLILDVKLGETDDRQREVAAWLAEVQPYEPILRNLLTGLPGTPQAAKAEVLLEYLDRARAELAPPP